MVGKNQGFILISNLHSNNVIGYGGELNQSGKSVEGHGGSWRVVAEGGHRGWLWRVVEDHGGWSKRVTKDGH